MMLKIEKKGQKVKRGIPYDTCQGNDSSSRRVFHDNTCDVRETSHVNQKRWKTVRAKQTTFGPGPWLRNTPENLVSRHYFRQQSLVFPKVLAV
ncbi:hypothetical protein ANTQUA_LOCUS7834 [Anthophora quadrimaculata]